MQPRTSWTCVLLSLVLVSGFAVTGCGSAADSKGPDPLHLHLLCLAGPDGESVTCDGHERLTHFNSWVKEAVYLPHSTFSIWAVADRARSRRFIGVCIPDKWPRAVWKAKADFLAVAREAVAGSRPGQTSPAGCSSPGPTTPGSTKLVVVPAASPLADDVWQTVTSGAAVAPLNLAVVCDRSDSTFGAACNAGALLRVFDIWVTEGLLRPGASLSIEMVGREALRPVWELRVPDLPVGERTAFVLGARSELSTLFSGSTEKYTSTIVEAISTAVRRLREHRGVYRLVVLSDRSMFGIRVKTGHSDAADD
jgi:hypothetical protein